MVIEKLVCVLVLTECSGLDPELGERPFLLSPDCLWCGRRGWDEGHVSAE